MKFEEFWEIYINEDILEIYDIIKEVFSEKIEKQVRKEYDIDEVLTEFIGHYRDAKEYSKIIEFTKILKANNSGFHKEVLPYYNNFLIDYYCYHQKINELEEPIKDFLSSPLEDYDYLLMSLRKLIYYGHVELGNKIIESIYEKVRNSPILIQGAEFDLAVFKYHIELERLYNNYLTKNEFNWTLYKEALEKFDFEIRKEYILLAEEGLKRNLEETEEKFSKEFLDSRLISLEMLEKGFLRHMKEYKMPFPTSGSIWNYLYEYWENKRKGRNHRQYFQLEERSFKAFLSEKSGFLLHNTFEIALILWGSSYVYDFLLLTKIIDREDYDNAATLISNLKDEFIHENFSELWQYSFIHEWKQSEMVSEVEKKREKDLFEESYESKEQTTEVNSTKGFSLELLSDIENTLHEFEQNIEGKRPKQIKKISAKLGRNEKVTVKYKDGTIKNGVKFKRVKDDLEKGNCEIV